jgi:transcriptional regulator with XRE-family HTH domain
MAATLQDLRKAKFKTVKAFAEAYGVHPSTASALLRGKHNMVLTRQDVQRLADLFGVSFEECVKATDESFWLSYSGDKSSGYWRLENRWEREKHIEDDVRDWRARGGRDRLLFGLERIGALQAFGLPATATREDVMCAFREKVKAMSDGKGGYTGDMDKLVQAKEQALAALQVHA